MNSSSETPKESPRHGRRRAIPKKRLSLDKQTISWKKRRELTRFVSEINESDNDAALSEPITRRFHKVIVPTSDSEPAPAALDTPEELDIDAPEELNLDLDLDTLEDIEFPEDIEPENNEPIQEDEPTQEAEEVTPTVTKSELEPPLVSVERTESVESIPPIPQAEESSVSVDKTIEPTVPYEDPFIEEELAVDTYEAEPVVVAEQSSPEEETGIVSAEDNEFTEEYDDEDYEGENEDQFRATLFKDPTPARLVKRNHGGKSLRAVKKTPKKASSEVNPAEAGASKKTRDESGSSLQNKIVSGALVAGSIALVTIFATNDFVAESQVYAETQTLLEETSGEIVDKTYDDSTCPSNLYAHPVNSNERERSMMWGEVSPEGDPLVCLDPPYFLTVMSEGEEVRIPVEEVVYDAYETGDTYAFDENLYEQRSPSVRTQLPEEDQTVLKYTVLFGAIALAGAAGFTISSSIRANRK